MKNWNSLYTICLVLLCSAQVLGKNDVEGKWINSNKGLTIHVETTSKGIRVKRADQETWYEYEEYRLGQYRDEEGHNYYLVDGDKLEWEDRTGARRIVFVRGSDLLEQKSEKSGDHHIERNHYYGNAFRPSQLEGRWRNQSSGQSIFVQSHRDLIKVRAHRGGWTTFYRDDRNTYTDLRGNKYDIIAGKLVYSSRSGDFRMVFIPS